MDALTHLSAHVGAIAQSLASVVQQLAIVTSSSKPPCAVETDAAAERPDTVVDATSVPAILLAAAASSNRDSGSGSRSSTDETIHNSGDVALDRVVLWWLTAAVLMDSGQTPTEQAVWSLRPTSAMIPSTPTLTRVQATMPPMRRMSRRRGRQ